MPRRANPEWIYLPRQSESNRMLNRFREAEHDYEHSREEIEDAIERESLDDRLFAEARNREAKATLHKAYLKLSDD